MVSTAKKRLSANVCQLSLGWDKTETNKTLHEFETHKMTIKFNLFSAFMENRVFGYVDSSKIVTFDRYRSDGGNGKFVQQPAEPGEFSS